MGPVTFRIDATLRWVLTRTPKGVIVSCDAVGLTLEATDAAEAKSLIDEGLHQYFSTHWEYGTLEELLHEKGWGFTRALGTEGLRFDVAWELCESDLGGAEPQ